MNKLQKYNQILLAIFGTLIVLFALLGGIFALSEILRDLNRDPDIGEEGVRITETQKNDTLPKENVKIQEITYLDPIQLDSGIDHFLIPVSQVNLDVPEMVISENGMASLLNMYESSGYHYRNYYGYFNNFLLFEYSTNTQSQLFSEKVSLNHWVNLDFAGRRLLLFKGSSFDSNDDGFLNDDDYQELFVYHIVSKSMIPIKIPNSSLESFAAMPETDLIHLRVGIDKNKDGFFDELREPYLLYSYNVDSKEIRQLISEETKENLQEVIQ